MALNDSKVSTELNLALSIPYSERYKALDLNEGFYSSYNEWELVIRYFGSLENIIEIVPFSYTELYNGYAVIRISEEYIDKLSNVPQIIFIDKPKSIYFQQNFLGISELESTACFNFLNYNETKYTGEGVLVCIIDTGINYRHPEFIDDNRTVIYEIWDQNIDGNPPPDMNLGSVFTEEDINVLISSEGNMNQNIADDNTGHGTGVAGIIHRLVPDARLLIVKLRENYSQSISRTTSIMLGITYAIKKSMELGLPLVINISFGNNYGDHDSDAIIEKYIDSVSGLSKLSIVTGMGNEGATSRHAEFNLNERSWHQEEFLISRYETAINIQIWRDFVDRVDISLITPNGIELGPFNIYLETMKYNINNMNIFVLNGYPTPVNRYQETYISIIPTDNYLQEGIWKIKFYPKNIINGRVNIWLPVASSTSSELKFLRPSEFTTMTIPSTSRSIISVGAFNQDSLTYAAFSGRGYTVSNDIKPDISAPGVNIEVPSADGGYNIVSGTSFSAPFVSAACAVLMEYGITDGNDPFLYGEKLKEYLIRGAKKLPNPDPVPNEKIGWGVLCISDAIPDYY
ncbi:MAG: S8 family serine peptidase [Lachnospiraceae bacterium]|nr:S8 family serine peptidase [Lachnospiraceae bacterium]